MAGHRHRFPVLGVFAEARTDDDVGYALAPTAVAERIGIASGRTEPVATGECLRP